MFHEVILYISYRKYNTIYILINNMHCEEHNLDSLMANFSVFRFVLHPQIPDFQIVVSQPNIVLS